MFASHLCIVGVSLLLERDCLFPGGTIKKATSELRPYKVASRRAGDVFRRREDTPDEHDILAVALVLEVIPPPAEELIHLEPNRDQDRITCQPQGVPENREGHLA